ncbi:MAG: O-antigen ligase family protein [Pseudomonadota bacterium]
MGSNVWWKALVLAGPVLLFPVARSYYVFYVAIMGWALWEARGALFREERAVLMAVAAFFLPVLVTFLAALVSGGADPVWLKRGGAFLLGGLLALATARLFRDARIQPLATALISLAVCSWLLDGCLQLLAGQSIDCRGGASACLTDPRWSLYFATNTKLSYFAGMMAFLPTSWLIRRRRYWLACAVLVMAGVTSMAMGSRFGMLAFLVGLGALGFVVALGLGRRAKLLIFVAAPLAILAVGAVFYQVNPEFHARMARTLSIFSATDYRIVNNALSGRLDIWLPTLAMLGDGNWLFGIGPGNLDTAIRPYFQPGNVFANAKVFHAHQVMIDILAATGLVGLLAFLAYYGWAARQFLRYRFQDIDLRWGALLVFLLMWFPLNSAQGFYSSEMMFLTFYMLGLGFGFRPVAPLPASSATGADGMAPLRDSVVV